MQMIIEARLVDDVQETARIQLAVIDREMTTSPLGLPWPKGRRYWLVRNSTSFAPSARASERRMLAARSVGRG